MGRPLRNLNGYFGGLVTPAPIWCVWVRRGESWVAAGGSDDKRMAEKIALAVAGVVRRKGTGPPPAPPASPPYRYQRRDLRAEP
jgi:hypothetical protein